MTLYPEKLAQYLSQNGIPAVLRIFGDETLLRNDCLELVRAHAKQQGVDERLHFIQDQQFDWHNLYDSGQSMSLFASHKLIELELPEAKPGREGADFFRNYVKQPPQDQYLVISGPKLKKEQLKAKWFTALDALGPLVSANAPERSRLPAFIHQRAKQHQLSLQDDAVQMLANWYEGNLLALDQQLTKLALQNLPQPLSVEKIRENSEDNSRFQVFALQESLLQGDLEQSLHRLQRLLADDVEPAILAWVLQRELQNLLQLKQAQDAHQDLNQAARPLGIWSSQVSAYSGWLKRLDSARLTKISDLLCRYELAFKRDSGEDLATLATHIVIALCARHSLPQI